ncbi:hypothetical protein MAQ5080_03227 [Marinomonas aquimarina]|uniref:DUF4810 domain-containing protein n=1 Tax=Marinomonas aquimarina TaxID=295068 RepID=A0A1A8TND4_9GAMM|nr:DUF4810 domain-containing protein [Marinomonas aquimarina]SBS35631.1 hypothetical protein MAQ5080_03227 [Marinomonas aquimarina]
MMRMAMTAKVLGGVALTLLVSGCSSTQPTFYWGNYEPLIYSMYMEPGRADSGTQIALLTEDIERAAAKGIRIAPGIHAHLGYMYALQGNMAQAKSEFLIEKSLFPESSVLVDGMLQRLQGAKR